MSDLNLEGAPDSPIERLNWLFERELVVLRELDEAYSRAYFDARLAGDLKEALALNLHGKKRILAMTRRENYRRGSSVRWMDNIDRRSAPYWD